MDDFLGIEGELDEDGLSDLYFYAEENSTNYGNQIPEWYDDDEFDLDDDEWLEG